MLPSHIASSTWSSGISVEGHKGNYISIMPYEHTLMSSREIPKSSLREQVVSHELSNESRPCLGHGKPDASKACMHKCLDMHVVPCDCSKAHGCLLSNVGMRALLNTRACGIKIHSALLRHEAARCIDSR